MRFFGLMLDLSFKTREIRTLCEEDIQAEQQLGAAAAGALRHRLGDLHAATTVLDLLIGNLRPDSASTDRCVYLLDLEDGWVLRFRPNHANLPLATDGMVDWARVSRIQILDISRVTGAEDRSNA